MITCDYCSEQITGSGVQLAAGGMVMGTAQRLDLHEECVTPVYQAVLKIKGKRPEPTEVASATE